MNGSLKIFTWLGIPVFVHFSFGLVFLLVFGEAYAQGLSPSDTLWLSGLTLAIFGCVLLHEYGHALAARRYGVGTRDIVLMPIGGMARLERMPEKPWQEFVVAVAGPLVNVVIAALTVVAIVVLAQPEQVDSIWSRLTGEPYEETGVKVSKLLENSITFALCNIGLFIFNMIPAFPMDGGRVLRALLSMRLGRAKATRIASWIGIGFGVLFVIFGFYTQSPMLPILGAAVAWLAFNENSVTQAESLLGRFKASDLVRPQYTRLQSNDWMMNAIETLQHGLERHFLVFDIQGELVGLLEEPDIIAAQRKPDVTAAVSKYMQKAEVVALEESLLRVHHLIRRGYGLVGVADAEGQLVGVIDEAGLSYFLKNRG